MAELEQEDMPTAVISINRSYYPQFCLDWEKQTTLTFLTKTNLSDSLLDSKGSLMYIHVV